MDPLIPNSNDSDTIIFQFFLKERLLQYARDYYLDTIDDKLDEVVN